MLRSPWTFCIGDKLEKSHISKAELSQFKWQGQTLGYPHPHLFNPNSSHCSYLKMAEEREEVGYDRWQKVIRATKRR
jgi:hypothetical protein